MNKNYSPRQKAKVALVTDRLPMNIRQAVHLIAGIMLRMSTKRLDIAASDAYVSVASKGDVK